jgi:hypothetical protein
VRLRLGLAMMLSLALLCGLALPASAGEPVKQREFVWGISAFNGSGYSGTFSPLEAPTIYLEAGQQNILTSSYTLVYYWPIDHEYKPDWGSLDEPVTGTLEILDTSGQVIQKVQLQDYLLTSADMTVIGSDRLLLGTDADAAYNNYVAQHNAFLAADAKYSSDLQAYWKAMAQDPSRTDLQPPDAPPAFSQALAPPSQGYDIQVQPGTYQIQFRTASGEIIPESKRTVIGVTPQVESVGYTVVPESHWTTTETSNDSSQIIYFAEQGATVYLQPNQIVQYNAQLYARVANPQDVIAASNRSTWVETGSIDGLDLEVWVGDHLLARVQKQPYSVEQLPGSALGYQIVPFTTTDGTAPDLQAYEISAVAATSTYTVRLVDRSGVVIPGSERVLVRASNALPGISYGLALLPLLGAVVIVGQRRRRRARSLKAIADAGA